MDLTLVVPAAGQGTRLHDATGGRPKTLLRVAGEPLLEHVLRVGAALPLRRVVVVVSPRGGEVAAWLGARWRHLPVTCVVQEEPRGLTHALSLAEPHVREAVLVLLGDEVYAGTRHAALYAHFLRARPDGICGLIAGADADRIRRNYTVALDAAGRITRLQEKPRFPFNDLLGTGTWLFRRELFAFLRPLLHTAAPGGPDFAAVVQAMVDAGRTVLGYRLGGRYVNVNTLADLRTAEAMLGVRQPALAPGAA